MKSNEESEKKTKISEAPDPVLSPAPSESEEEASGKAGKADPIADKSRLSFHYAQLPPFQQRLSKITDAATLGLSIFILAVAVNLYMFSTTSVLETLGFVFLPATIFGTIGIRWYKRKLLEGSGILYLDREGISLQGTRNMRSALHSMHFNDLTDLRLAENRSSRILLLEFDNSAWSSEKRKVLSTWTQSRGSKTILPLDLSAFSKRKERQLLNSIASLVPAEKISTQNRSKIINTIQEGSFTELWLSSLHRDPSRKTNRLLQAGQRIGDQRYEILRTIGAGGQGTAYEAIDHLADSSAGQENRVVLKEFLLPVHADEDTIKLALISIEREAAIMRRAKSPQIAELFDTFVDDSRAYLAIEYIDGKSLREIINDRGCLPASMAMELGKQMCEILSQLHKLKPAVIHRDFTPDNLILTGEGTLKLIDFDVAHQEDLPCSTHVVGKPSYIAPEQFRGQATTASDIYSLGSTLHFLLTGSEPTPIQASHPKTKVPDLDERINDLVARTTAVDSSQRPISADALKEEIAVILEQRQ